MDNYEEIKMLLQNNDQSSAAAKAKEYLENLDKVPLTIAITGETGSGKSTLVNALRGLKDNDKGAACTGVTETTMEPTEYPHPNNPNIKIWDLPGIGSTSFKADKYLKHVGFEKFDFFIIVSDTRFRENDAKLAQEIQKMNKKFYFVRSKIDDSLRAAERSQREFNEEKTLKQIRDNCVTELQMLGIKSSTVFLISSFELHLFDFKTLVQKLEEDLPQLQRDALLLALPNISLDVINKKKKVLNARIKWHALASAAGAAVPIPGFSVPIDVAIIVTFVIQCQTVIGLTEESLLRLSLVTGVSLGDLRAELQSPLAGVKVRESLVARALASCATFVAATAVEEVAGFVPLIGIPISMGLSFGTTYATLSYLLKTLTEDAQRVFTKALGLTTSI